MKVRIKKLFVIAFLLFSLSIRIPVYAADDHALFYEDFYDADEFEEIQKTIYESPLFRKNGLTSEIEKLTIDGSKDQMANAYKVYTLKSTDFMVAVQEGEDLSKLISDDYDWIVSTSSNESIHLSKSNGEWEVLGYSTPSSKIAVNETVQISTLDQQVKNLADNEKAVKSLLCFEMPRYHTSFVYVSTESDNFLVPYGSRPDLTGLENGKLYTPKEVYQILERSFGATNESEKDGGVGVDQKAESTSSLVTWGCAFVLVAISGMLFVFIRKQKQY